MGFLPIMDMQTPPSTLRSGQIFMKDAEWAE